MASQRSVSGAVRPLSALSAPVTSAAAELAIIEEIFVPGVQSNVLSHSGSHRQGIPVIWGVASHCCQSNTPLWKFFLFRITLGSQRTEMVSLLIGVIQAIVA